MCGFEIDRDSTIWDPMVWRRGGSKTQSWFGIIDTLRNGPVGDHTIGTSKGERVKLKKIKAMLSNGVKESNGLDTSKQCVFNKKKQNNNNKTTRQMFIGKEK